MDRKANKHILAVVLSLLRAYIYAGDGASVDRVLRINFEVSQPRELRSNGKENFELWVFNDGNAPLHNVRISASSDVELEINLDMSEIGILEAGETYRINMEIVSRNMRYFNERAFIIFRISTDELATRTAQLSFTIRPVERFWFFVIISLTSALTLLFILIFVKLNKGEKNVG
jgi:uncharacterized membrane protein